MKSIVLDTNVFVSGIFWSGPPYLILNAWRNKKIELVISQEILEEYTRVGVILGEKYRNIELLPFIDLVTIYGKMYFPIILHQPVSQDPDDDKFIACALSANCKIIVSGDKDLLSVSGYAGLEILKPASFVKKYLETA